MTFKLVLSLLLTASLCSCANVSSALSNQKTINSDDSSPIVSREISVKNISEIEAARGVTVVYKQGTSTSVTVSAPRDIADYIVTDIDGSSILCTVDKDYQIHNGMDRVVVNIVCPKIKSLEASTGATISMESALDLGPEKLSVDATTAGYVEIRAVKCGDLDCDVSTAGNAVVTGIVCSGTLDVDASTGSTADFEGTAGKVDFDASTGARINAYGLYAPKGDADSSTGADISCKVEYLNSSSSTGGTIDNKR